MMALRDMLVEHACWDPSQGKMAVCFVGNKLLGVSCACILVLVHAQVVVQVTADVDKSLPSAARAALYRPFMFSGSVQVLVAGSSGSASKLARRLSCRATGCSLLCCRALSCCRTTS
jgi:hypothetical protein